MLEIKVRIIKEQADYHYTLARIQELMEAKEGSKESYELSILSLMVDDYQKNNYPLPKVSPLELIEFLMEQHQLRQVDLAPLMGGTNRVSEVLSGKRKLTLSMIKNLSQRFHLPISAFI